MKVHGVPFELSAGQAGVINLLKNSGYCMSDGRLDPIEFLADCTHGDFNIAPDLTIHRSCAEVPKALPRHNSLSVVTLLVSAAIRPIRTRGKL